MRIRKKKWAEPELSVCNFYVKNSEENAGKWMQAFCQRKSGGDRFVCADAVFLL